MGLRAAAPSRPAVGVPAAVTGHPTGSGAGKMWHRVLAGLAGLGMDIRVVDDPARSREGRRIDVWLHDGHLGRLPVRRPVVAHLHEAPWSEPAADHHLDPEFARTGLANGQAAADQARLIVTPSAFSKAQIVRTHGVDPGRIRVVHHGV
ncbi:MAG TPA: glycosyltransferase, partial [Acidimicrobiales bacterium]|nr:glycosyltransferase [Acidimicrobiales bacterium]